MFEAQYCVLDLFGHQKIAGKVSEQEIGGQTFVRVDVPATSSQPAFTKFFGQGAIYSITPVDEATCKRAVESYQVEPIEVYRLVVPERRRLSDPDGYDEEPDGYDENF